MIGRTNALDKSHQQALPQQGRIQKHTRLIEENYQALTLLLSSISEKQGQFQSPAPRSPRGWGRLGSGRLSFTNQAQVRKKLRDTIPSLYPSNNTVEARRSRSIDQAIREEQLQPWSISDAVLASHGDHPDALFTASMMAAYCDDRNKLHDKVLEAVKVLMQRLLEEFTARDKDSVPDEAWARGLELQKQLVATDGGFTEEMLSLFEYLWSLEEFRALPHGLYGTWPSHDV